MASPEKDVTFKDLFDFYYSEYKPLYSDVTSANHLSQETLFEVTAAFDHVARFFSPNANPDETESYCAKKAMSHLKRACLDMYKLEYVYTKDVYDKLCRLPINLIDNGEFEKKLHKLFAETRVLAKEARRLEGVKKADSPELAFEIWGKAYVNCKRITSDEFYLNPNVGWAKRNRKKLEMVGIILSVLSFLWGILTFLGIIPQWQIIKTDKTQQSHQSHIHFSAQYFKPC